MGILDFLQKNSNSIGHLVMSLVFVVVLMTIILTTHDAATVTVAFGLMTLLFGFWFGAQSTAIKHVDATIAAASTSPSAIAVAVSPPSPVVDPDATDKVPTIRAG